MPLRHIVISAIAGALFAGAPLFAQQRADLPPPNSSRAPLLVTMPLDSIRHYTAYLRLMDLEQALQTGQENLLEEMLKETSLTGSNCSLSASLSRLSQVRDRVFFDKVAIRDSVVVQIISADLILVPISSPVPKRQPITMRLDPERAIWSEQTGLLEALCAL